MKKNYDLNLKISNNNTNSVNKKENLDVNKKDNENNNNNIKRSINENTKNKSKEIIYNKEIGNNINENITLGNDKEDEDEKKNEKRINFKYISIISLMNKNNFSSKRKEQNKNNNFTIGNILFRGMNTFNINLLLNSLKNNNKYTLSNFENSIITSSPEEIRKAFNFIKNKIIIYQI